MDQEVDLEHKPGDAGHGTAMEIRSTLSQKVGASFPVLFMCGIGLLNWMHAVWPQLLPSRSLALPGVAERVFLFFGGSFMFGMGLYWSQSWFYRLRANAYSLTESLGWKERRVFWSDVHSYSMEYSRSQGRKERKCVQPVFRDAQGAVLFRLAPALSSLSDEAALSSFWSFVQLRLPGKEVPFVPPALLPHPWGGKSAAWKVKRVMLTLLCILAFVGLWSGVMAWAIAHPALPRWAEVTIGFAIFWIPGVAATVMAFIISLRQKRAAVDEAASTCGQAGRLK